MLKSSKMFRRASWFIALLASVCVANVTKADVQNYGDFVGPNIMYLNVTEETGQVPPPAPAELFGQPTLSGNVLDFNPMEYDAEANDGSSQFTDSQLSTTLMTANPQQFINQLSITEFGSYSLIGGTSGGTQAGVSIDPVQAKVLEVDGVPLAQPIVLPMTVTYTNMGAANSTTANGGITFESNGGMILAQPWSAVVEFDLSGVPGATKIDLALDNALAATSEDGSIAFIDKSDFQIVTSVVPEPSTVLLGIMGGLGLVLAGRKTWKKQVA